MAVEYTSVGEPFPLEGFPVFALGDTVTINVNGTEHSLVAYEDDGDVVIGDTYNEIDSGGGDFGWKAIVSDGVVCFLAYARYTVSYIKEINHPIDWKYLTNTTSVYSNGKLVSILHIPDYDYDDGQAGFVRLYNGRLRVKDVIGMPRVIQYNGASIFTAVAKPDTTKTLTYKAHSFDRLPDSNTQIEFKIKFSSGELIIMHLGVTSATSATAFTATGYFVDNDGALYTVVCTQSDGNAYGSMVIKKKS